MPDTPSRVYWRLREGETADYIGGWCAPEDVPGYGETGHCDLPTKIQRTEREDGGYELRTPILFGRTKAYRLRVVISRYDLPRLAEEKLDMMRRRIFAEHINSPEPGSERTNWYWYARTAGWRSNHDGSTPIRLMRKWTMPILEILTDGHPDRDQILADWAQILDADKAHRERNRDYATPGERERKAEGDIVIDSHARNYVSDTVRQVYQLRRYGRSGRLGPHAGHTRFKTPHKHMRRLTLEVLDEMDLEPPMRAACLFVLATRERPESNHAKLALRARFDPRLDAAEAAFNEWAEAARRDFKERAEDENHLRSLRHHAAVAFATIFDFGLKTSYAERSNLFFRELKAIDTEAEQALQACLTPQK